VTLIASLNARQGLVIEQLNTVFAGDPYDATNVRWLVAMAPAEVRIDSTNAINANTKSQRSI